MKTNTKQILALAVVALLSSAGPAAAVGVESDKEAQLLSDASKAQGAAQPEATSAEVAKTIKTLLDENVSGFDAIERLHRAFPAEPAPGE